MLSLSEACEKVDITEQELHSHSRHLNTVLKRQLVFLILRQSGYSLQEIGVMCRRDHSSVVHSINRIKSVLINLNVITKSIDFDNLRFDI